MTTSSPQKKKIYQRVSWLLLAIAVIGLIRLAPILVTPQVIASDDYLRFWAGGRLNLHGENPYDLAHISQLQVEAGDTLSNQNSLMLNPPWAIALIMPFGLPAYPISRVIWLLISAALILLASQMLWRVYSGEQKQRWLAMLIVFIFAPTISTLEKGQVTSFILLGIAGFLYFTVITRNDWLAGLFLAISTIKPQLILLFFIALIFWIIHERRWIILLSMIAATLALTLVSTLFNPYVIQQYLSMLVTYQVSDWAVPTFGSYLRYFWLGLDQFWLQFLPFLLGLIWFIFYWKRYGNQWNWAEQMPIILLVSILTSPYAWTYDLVVLLPAVILAVIWLIADWKSWSSILLLALFLLINFLDLVLHMKLDEFWFIWLAPALFIWYLAVRWKVSRIQDKPYTSKVQVS
ncbi:MAG: hypothetical protein C3F13_05270 [Anaerolineales bacterium]|nr:MAG: hypothetical protein C3F13_05270 [Anaerolineales bacterium]